MPVYEIEEENEEDDFDPKGHNASSAPQYVSTDLNGTDRGASLGKNKDPYGLLPKKNEFD